jgi:hypothetical protein
MTDTNEPCTGRIIEDIKAPDDWLPDDFEVVLRYIYTGKATVKSQQQAERVSAIGFEYLLDNLMRFCQRSTTFPASVNHTNIKYQLLSQPTLKGV